MWQVEEIQATNFMSFDSVLYSFENKTFIVRAENKDNNGQQSNGGGKTSFVDILPIALLGYSLTGRALKDCVNWNSDKGYFETSVFLRNDELEQIVRIDRKVYSKSKSAELCIRINGTVPSTLPTKTGVENGVDIKEGNKYILKEILDISESDLLNYFLISKSHYNPFLEVNTDKKLEVIGRFTNTQAVDRAIKHLETSLEVDNDSIEEYDDKINTAQGYIKALEDRLKTDIEKDFIKKKEADIAQIQAKQKEIEEGLVQLDEEREDIICQSEVVARGITEIDPQVKKRQLDKHEEIETAIVDLKKEKQQLVGDVEQIQNYLAGLITCPACEHKFHLREKETFTQDDVTALELGLDEFNEKIAVWENLLKESTAEMLNIANAEHSNRTIQLEIDIKNRKIKAIEQQQERLFKELDKTTEELTQVEDRTLSNERYAIRQQIKGKESEISAYQVQRQELEEKINKDKRWVQNFEDFKFYLGNKPIELICSLVNQYLKLSGSDLNLHIEGFKKLKSGELRQALNPVIYRSWMNPQPFSQFSEGEKVRLNLAVDLAFQQLINSSSKNGGLNYYCSDEMINSLDSEGVKNAAEAFNQLDKSIVLVTHSGADLVYKNTIVIEKENNISKVII